MPDGLLPDEGLAEQLGYILRAPISGVLPWQLMLWVNDVEPTYATTLGELVEATFGGYGRLTMDRALWTSPTVANGCAVSTWTATPTEWTNTSGPEQTPFGYAFVDVTRGTLVFVQRFDSADIAPLKVGEKLSLLPRYTLTSATCGGSV